MEVLIVSQIVQMPAVAMDLPMQILFLFFWSKGSSTNNVTVIGGGGGQGFCDGSTKALVIQSVTMGVSKIVENCVTSFMDDP